MGLEDDEEHRLNVLAGVMQVVALSTLEVKTGAILKMARYVEDGPAFIALGPGWQDAGCVEEPAVSPEPLELESRGTLAKLTSFADVATTADVVALLTTAGCQCESELELSHGQVVTLIDWLTQVHRLVEERYTETER